ncbi:inactive pancreatic lipase-related 1-like, partial [Brachionus plicatilis]
ASNLESLGFDHSKETKLVVHGFSADSSSLTALKNKLLIFDDVNVIMVNWKEGAKAPDYYNAFTNVREVAQKIADFVQQGKIDLSKVHCIGHSLGAHVCGFAGKRIVGKIGRISGLDPAGPLFEGKPVYSRLDKTDAEFVDIIHTDATLGIQDSI